MTLFFQFLAAFTLGHYLAILLDRFFKFAWAKFHLHVVTWAALVLGWRKA